jgi:hypothetical protein
VDVSREAFAICALHFQTAVESILLKLRPCQLTLHRQNGSFHDPAPWASHSHSEEVRTQWRLCTTVRVTYQLRCLPTLESFLSESLQKSTSNPLQSDRNMVGHANNVEHISYAGRVGYWNQHSGSITLHISALSPSLMLLHQHWSQAWRHEKHIDRL